MDYKYMDGGYYEDTRRQDSLKKITEKRIKRALRVKDISVYVEESEPGLDPMDVEDDFENEAEIKWK